jgi:hypothetical protein
MRLLNTNGKIVYFFVKSQRQLQRKSKMYRYIRSGQALILLNWRKSLSWKYSQTPRIPGQCPP